MYRLLIVEDDADIAAAVAGKAASWGLEAKCVEDMRHVMAEFAAFSPHIVLLDITLPFFDGYHWCREIRRVSQVPVVFLSSAAQDMNIIMAVNMGADDFIAKPFDMAVLMAKLQALLRRSYAFAGSMPVLEHRGALYSTADGRLTWQGQNIELSKNESRILGLLMSERGRVVSRERLMEHLWATDSFVDENTLSVNVNRLRKKLEAVGLHDFIATRVGEGYGLLESKDEGDL